MDYLNEIDGMVNYAASAGLTREEGHEFVRELINGQQKATKEINSGTLTPREVSERELVIRKVTGFLENLLLRDRVLSRETKRLIAKAPAPVLRY